MKLFHPIQNFRGLEYDDSLLVPFLVAAFWAIVVIAIVVNVFGIIGAELGYHNWRCAYADCKTIIIKRQP